MVTTIASARNAGIPLGLLYLDVNRFKGVNDKFGHLAGDALLIEIATRIRRQLRRIDLAARLGGDEFAILLSPPSESGDMAAITERIHMAMREPVIMPDGSEILSSLSIGSALFPRDGDDAARLLRAADEAMYASKRRIVQSLSGILPSRWRGI